MQCASTLQLLFRDGWNTSGVLELGGGALTLLCSSYLLRKGLHNYVNCVISLGMGIVNGGG